MGNPALSLLYENILSDPLVTIIAKFSKEATLTIANVQDGIAAYKKGGFETTIFHFRSLAQQGLAEAECLLGMVYMNGEFAPKDSKEAMKCFFESS